MVTYDIIAPNWASNFYHVYTETVLEALLAIFWLVAFASIGSYVAGLGSLSSYLSGALSLIDDSSVAQHDKRSTACLTAVAVFGGFTLYVSQ